MHAVYQKPQLRAAEDSGVCGQLQRSHEHAYDFCDKEGNKWDIKQFNSYFITHPEFYFSFETFVKKLKKEIDLGEKIFLDITHAEKSHLEKLLAVMNDFLSEEEKQSIKTIIKPERED